MWPYYCVENMNILVVGAVIATLFTYTQGITSINMCGNGDRRGDISFTIYKNATEHVHHDQCSCYVEGPKQYSIIFSHQLVSFESVCTRISIETYCYNQTNPVAKNSPYILTQVNVTLTYRATHGHSEEKTGQLTIDINSLNQTELHVTCTGLKRKGISTSRTTDVTTSPEWPHTQSFTEEWSSEMHTQPGTDRDAHVTDITPQGSREDWMTTMPLMNNVTSARGVTSASGMDGKSILIIAILVPIVTLIVIFIIVLSITCKRSRASSQDTALTVVYAEPDKALKKARKEPKPLEPSYSDASIELGVIEVPPKCWEQEPIDVTLEERPPPYVP